MADVAPEPILVGNAVTRVLRSVAREIEDMSP